MIGSDIRTDSSQVRLSVSPLLALHELSAATSDQGRPYDALIAAVGYESRARYLAETWPAAFARIWAYEYAHNRVLAYPDNLKVFRKFGEVFDEPDSAYIKHLSSLIRDRRYEVGIAMKGLKLRGSVRFAVDISSMDRDRLARTVRAFYGGDFDEIEVDFLYSIAPFDPSYVGDEGRVTVNRSVEGFEGWTVSPDLPVVCVLGAGFEGRLALAALETLEPSGTLVLLPSGISTSYDEVVKERNEIVLADKSSTRYVYDVTDPYGTLSDLEATVAALSREHRVVVVPLGPKIFALCSILTALVHETNVTVWRLSADSDRRAEDRGCDGSVVGLRVRIQSLPVASQFE
jgi:hypothetical protein